MLKHLPSLHRLMRNLQYIPFLASKNLYRVAAYIITSEEKQIEQLCRSIMDAREKIHPCSICFNWAEDAAICAICASEKRDKSSICVVETWHDLWAIEKVEDFRGVYHVLGGALCPLEGRGPDNLTISQLVKRVDGQVKEIILATNQTPEGEATASFIASKLDGKPVHVSRLASGVPIGASLEYLDRVTIHKAFLGRRPF